MPLSFINSDLKQKVDRLMDTLWAGGVNIPSTSIEQISYLMFMKSLTEMDERHAELAKKTGKKYAPLFAGSLAKYSWRTVSRLTGDELYHTLTEAFEKLHELPNLSAIGKILFRQAHLKIYSRPTLKSVVQIIDELDYNNAEKYDTDVKGDLYEYLLSKIGVSGANGQFRTPRHIIKTMVQLLDPQPGDYILDPACGTAGFLIEAYKYMLESHTSKEELKQGHKTGDLLRPDQFTFLKQHAFNGYDNDAEMIKFAIMNLYLHGLESANVRHFDPLTMPNPHDRKYDIILANPPFAGKINQEAILEDINLSTSATELLFVKYMIDHLAPGGRCAVIVPEGVLFGGTRAHKKLREILLDENELLGVVSLAAKMFSPYSGVKTSILIFKKGGKTDRVWFYDVTADGFSLDDKRTPTDKNDLPDLIAQFPLSTSMSSSRKRGSTDFPPLPEGRLGGVGEGGGSEAEGLRNAETVHSWSATRAQITENDANLSASRYQPYKAEEVKYDEPGKIIEEVRRLENDIIDSLRVLAKKLERDLVT